MRSVREGGTGGSLWERGGGGGSRSRPGRRGALAVKGARPSPPGPFLQERPTGAPGLTSSGLPRARGAQILTPKYHWLEAGLSSAPRSGRGCRGAAGCVRARLQGPGASGQGVERWTRQSLSRGDLGALVSSICTPLSPGRSKFKSRSDRPRPRPPASRGSQDATGASRGFVDPSSWDPGGHSGSRSGRQTPRTLGALPSAAPAARVAEEEPRPGRHRPGSSSPRPPGPSHRRPELRVAAAEPGAERAGRGRPAAAAGA